MSEDKSPSQAAEQQTVDVSEAQIAAHWPEEGYFSPSNQFIAHIANKVSASVVSAIGAIARPRQSIIVPDMPKTRSGKIMRRVLAAISNRQDPGDGSTLANPEIVDRIKELAK